jgi:hypothetical protein
MRKTPLVSGGKRLEAVSKASVHDYSTTENAKELVEEILTRS